MELVGLSAKGGVVGEYRVNTKLTSKQVAEMLEMRRQEGLSYERLGKRFGVSHSQAYRICKGKNWNLEPVEFVYQATPEELDQVAQYAAKGLGHHSIAKLMGVTRMSAFRMLQKVRDDQNHRGE